MQEYIEVGSTPPVEECAQVGQDGYYEQARKECKAYLDLLRRTLGEEPQGARLYIKSNPHDYGEYLEVVCRYDDRFPEAVEYAFRCEGEGPQEWDNEAKQALGLIH